MATLEDISTKIDTLTGYVRAAFAPQVASEWKWTDDQADTDIVFADHDYGALITTLVLGSAGALTLVEVKYTLGFASGGETLTDVAFGDVITALERHGEEDGVGFELFNFGAGFVFLPGVHRMAVLPYPLVRSLTIFQVDMVWESSVTGERAEKDVHLAPRLDPPLPGRRGVPPVRSKADVDARRPASAGVS